MNVFKLLPLLQREFDPKETMRILTYNKPIYWSWGVFTWYNIKNKGLLLKVSGRHHKGLVLITLAWNDTYTVQIINMRKVVLQTYEMVYFDNLVEVIDNRI